MIGADFKNYFFWFETNKVDKDNYRSFYFNNPSEIIILDNAENMESFFSRLEELTRKYYVAGFFSYELGYLFEKIFHYKKKSVFPYAVFCVFEKPVIYDHKKKEPIAGNPSSIKKECGYTIKNLRLNVSRQEYYKNINKIRAYISKGDIYQANYTIKYKFDFWGSPLGLYQDLKKNQNVSYNVFAGLGDYSVLSLSPELFFYKNGSYLEVKPMKGTVKRGRNINEDEKNMSFLAHDEKNRSENIMIVDLLRNDLSRISETGSVKVIKLYEIEKYNTLFQMTSTIKSKLKKNLSVYELVKSIFPSGSVTGAPKIRSMEIIKELEKEERKIYTGAIGFFMPDGEAKFNVAIRTIMIRNNTGEMSVGGGIVYDSKSEDEFQECKLKAQFLIKKNIPAFSLFETILFEKNFKYLELHLRRLKESAEYFDFKFNRTQVKLHLIKLKELLSSGKYKVRIILDKSGKIKLNYNRLNNKPEDFKITISKYKINRDNIYYFHKTTNRELYERELKKARGKGFFDIIFSNERGEITEGSITNVYIKNNGSIYTPPVGCGLLNGIIRQTVIRKYNVQEKILTARDFKNANSIYISNSVIGFRKAYF